jgi:predicted nucleic acid-binding protein
MSEPLIRVYADTSVYGGVFDEEFVHASQTFFQNVRKRRFRLVISEAVRDELAISPEPVRRFADDLLPISELLQVSQAALGLQQAFLKAKIVTEKSKADAFHVALATAGQCGILVSWNCRHIVHFEKVPLYNSVSVKMGYAPLKILTPLEVAYADR